MTDIPKPTSQKFYHLASQAVEWSLIALLGSLTFSISLSEIAIGSALIAWVIKKIIDHDFSFLKDPIYLTLTAFVTFVGLSVANSEFFYISFRGMIKAVKGIIVFLMLIDTFRTREQVIRVSKVIIFLFLIILLNGMWQYFTGTDLIRGKSAGFFNDDFRRRITSSFNYYSQLGAFLILCNGFFLGLVFGKAGLKKNEIILMLLLFALGSIGLFHTASRASWIAFISAIIFLGLIRRSKIILGGTAIAVLLGMFLLPDYMLIHFDSHRKEQSASERIMLARRAVDVIKAHPFLGCGINTYNAVHEKYDQVKDTRVRGYYAHNGYLQLAAEIGIFGITFFIFFLILMFINIFRKARDNPDLLMGAMSHGILAGCFGFLVLVSMDTVLQSYQANTLFWMFFALSRITAKLTHESTSRGFLA